jgi:hypothetical protein
MGEKLFVTDSLSPKKQTYLKYVELSNHTDICLLLWDLKRLFNAPIDKAIAKYNSEKDNPSPFW